MKENLDPKISNIFPIWKLFPNFVTILALCSGISSLRFALIHKWEMAVLCIIIAAFLDLLDGRVARLFKVTSNFGAQLDSLADFVSFGVMPPLILYLWNLHNITIRGVAWSVVLLYIICTVIRLARFNCIADEDEKNSQFIGIPSTVAAIIVLVPLMLKFQINVTISSILLALYMVIVSLLMVSTIPTPSSKHFAIKRDFTYVTLLLFSCAVIAIIMEPWIFIPLICLAYLIVIIFYAIKKLS